MATRKKKSAKKAANGNGHRSLLRELWNAAVALRGPIEAPDYKRYVLPLIFLRFLSLRFEKRREELEALIADHKSEYHTTDPKVRESILEDPDEYRAVGAFIVPKGARWSEIRDQAQEDDLKVRLDNILELLEKAYPEQLRGLLPRIYADSNMQRDHLAGLINLFSKDVFKQDHGGEDLIGKVYEYFIGEFASSEGKRGGEYFTPASIVRTLVAMLEPTEGIVFDPCCGSGGMFVQSDVFTKHSGRLSFVGQEAKEFTYRLCRMNLFIHGIDGNIHSGNSYTDDKHAALRADFVLANPPFNDGSKGDDGWGADKVSPKDPRLLIGATRLPLSARNANTMWMLHFLRHLNDHGCAGFVMAAGELSNQEIARRVVREALIRSEYVDCVVQLSGKLFANTPSPCALILLSKDRAGRRSGRDRLGEVLLIDARKLGSLIPGSARQHFLSDVEVQRIASLYRHFRTEGAPAPVPGFAAVATIDQIATEDFALTPARFVPSPVRDEEDEAFEEKFPRLRHSVAQLSSLVSDELSSLDLELNALSHSMGLLDLSFRTEDDYEIPEGWSLRTVEEVSTLVRRGRAPKYLDVGGVCVLNQKCVRFGMVDFGPSRRHDASQRPMGDRELQPGDILVNSTGVGTLGRTAQVWWLPEPTTVDSHVTIIRPNTEAVLPEVLGAIFLALQPELDRMGEGSTGQTELGRERLANLKIAVPPRALQEQVAPLLKTSMLAVSHAKRLLQDSIHLRDAIVPRLAQGEMRSSDLASATNTRVRA